MKYMGSKRSMLRNGLGRVLLEEASKHERFFDLFAGSAAVCNFVATRLPVRVCAADLQSYSAVLAGSVLHRVKTVEPDKLWINWFRRAKRVYVSSPYEDSDFSMRKEVFSSREWCASHGDGDITKAYGGHYYSPKQASWLDAFKAALPKDEPFRTVALAALIDAASECAAAPGHTAQPFQPTDSAGHFLVQSWNKSIIQSTRVALRKVAGIHAIKKGSACVSDAIIMASEVKKGDLIFLDPPYSGVHYSRFYHVLETLAAGFTGQVEGVGRYPPPESRPKSLYSTKSQSIGALRGLLEALSSKHASAILTFPDHLCSNGLSGDLVRDVCKEFFTVSEVLVKSRFSTMGGGSKASLETRAARQNANELIILMKS